MFDMLNMLGKAKDLQAKVQETKDRLAVTVIDALSDDQLVKVTINGKKQVLNLEIAESIQNKEQHDLMKNSVLSALNKAMAEMDKIYVEELKKSTEGLLPNIPGLDLGKILTGQ
ncbi:MAG: YbaB/EbfC family nucleoid-associated protein [Cytophagales bacterium]